MSLAGEQKDDSIMRRVELAFNKGVVIKVLSKALLLPFMNAPCICDTSCVKQMPPYTCTIN